MKITNKILSIPPYLSTGWDNIESIQTKGSLLVITLKNRESIEIPGLKAEEIQSIFSHHTAYFDEQQEKPASNSQNPRQTAMFYQALMNADQAMEFPVRFGFGSMENMGSLLQHNPAQMNAPDLPKPILQKIAAISKIVAPEDIQALPKPEPHCNCMHCQVVRAITQGFSPHVEDTPEESVPEEELKFRQWDIVQNGDKLFTVINRLDDKEKYSVYLGQPIGCTCGKSGCEHIVAVLKS